MGRHNLGDYPEDPRQRFIEPAGRLNAAVRSPIDAPDMPKIPGDLCQCIKDALHSLPSKGSRGFVKGGNVTSVPNLASAPSNIVAVASLIVPEGYEAILQTVGWDVIPVGDYASITWQLKIGGEPEPYFNSTAFLTGTMNDPIAFHLEIPAGKTLELFATNGSSNVLQAVGRLSGFVRPKPAS